MLSAPSSSSVVIPAPDSFEDPFAHIRATVGVIGRARRLTLLVIDPDCSAQLARRALTAASSPGNSDGVDTLLASVDSGAADPAAQPG